MKALAYALALWSLCLGALATDIQQMYPEIDNCGKYSEARRNDTPVLHEQVNRLVSWEWGYLSAYNHYKDKQQVNVPDRATILAFFDKYCAANPLKHMASANQRLVIELGGSLL